MRARLIATLILLGAGHAALGAGAEPPLTPEERTNRAKTYYELGRAHFRLGEYEAATRDFEEGYRFEPRPLFLFNIGQSERLAGHSTRALEAYRQYLQLSPDAPERLEVKAYIADLSHSTEPQTSPRPTVTPPLERALNQPAQQPRTSPRKRTKLWAALGVAAGVLVAGTITAIVLSLPEGAPDSALGTYRPFK